MNLTHGELFAGVSGFGVGFGRSGIITKWHVEKGKHCQGVLRKHYPEALLLDDVTDCGAHNLTPVDIISFGSPCQDLSVAGKRKGMEGERSGLFFEAARIIRELNPRWAVWENVPGALSSHGGGDFQSVISELLQASVPMPRSGRWANAGMARSGQTELAWRVMDSQYFGVAQRRRRVFVVVDFTGQRGAEVLFESTSGAWNSAPSREARAELAGDAEACVRGRNFKGAEYESGLTVAFDWQLTTDAPVIDDMSSALSATRTPAVCHETGHLVLDGQNCTTDDTVTPTLQAGRADPQHLPCVYAIQDTVMGVRRLTPTECCRLQGFPDNWNGWLSDSARYQQMGNAVTVNVAHWIGRRIVEVS